MKYLDFWKQLLTESSLSQFAMIMVGETAAETESNYALEPGNTEMEYLNFEEESDQPLEVSDWMTNESYFGSSFLNIFEEKDAPLEVSDWMTETSYFGTDIRTEKDKELNLENWMIRGNHWNM